jgi:hypothetical protein
MAVSPDLYRSLSQSSRRALGFAAAAAGHREGKADAEVGPADLLVGLLLSHAVEDGEARVLLTHFGLTARDVLPLDYPAISADELRRRSAGLSIDAAPRMEQDVEAALQWSRGKEVSLRHVLGGLIAGTATPSPLILRLMERLEAAGTSLTELSREYTNWLATTDSGTPTQETAGAGLRKMLDDKLPRRAVDVPAYAADRVGDGDDLIGIRREVDAFAYLLVSKAQHPPLAVGLFGDWGSGKSFFMDAVHARIATIEAQIKDRPQAEVPFWKEVRQIRFNAWEYVQGSLWASLIDHIFRKLDGKHLDLVKTREDELVAARDEASEREKDQKEERERLADEVVTQQKAVQEAEEARTSELQKARAEHALRTQSALTKLSAEQLAGEDGAALAAAVLDVRAEFARGRGLLGAYWTPWRIVLATLIGLAVPAVAFAADQLGLPPAVSLLGGLSALVPAVTSLLRSSAAWMEKELNELERSARELAELERALDETVETKRAKLERSEVKLAVVKSAELAAGAEAASLATEIKDLTPGRVLGEFLQRRSSSDDYRRHLGLLARVREDLGNLESLVKENNRTSAEPKPGAPPNRIILYIDDLDRCSPEKVVEVLEAVHLLLAFELFVVVVAVDSRWLTSALTDELKALRNGQANGHRATPQDYLEKIFQLPFWVQPLSAEGRRSLVHGLLEGSVRTNGGNGGVLENNGHGLHVGPREEELLTAMLSRRGANPRLDAHVLAMTAEDLRFMESLSPLLGDTPRRVKRFVNVTQLLLALPPSLELDARIPPDRAVVAFLAAVNSGLPGLAPVLFDAVKDTPTRSLLEAVTQLSRVPEHERTRLKNWLGTPETAVWANLPLERLAARLDVVRRLTFDSLPEQLACSARQPPQSVDAAPGEGRPLVARDAVDSDRL